MARFLSSFAAVLVAAASVSFGSAATAAPEYATDHFIVTPPPFGTSLRARRHGSSSPRLADGSG